MHLTLTGNLGGGKSTICKILNEVYGYEIYSTGKVQRKLADDFGISVLEMNQRMKLDHHYDNMIDDMTARISRENRDKKIVFDSRLAWHFVEESFKIFLTVNIDEAARRVFNDHQRGNVEAYSSVEEAKSQLKRRAEVEDQRYKEIYGIAYFDFSNYNLILDSTYSSPELLAKIIIDEASAYYSDASTEATKLLFSMKRLGFMPDEAKAADIYRNDEIFDITSDGDDYRLLGSSEGITKLADEGCQFARVNIVQ